MNTPTIRSEKMSDIFEKFHIDGLPFDAVIHHFTEPDTGPAHDHPFSFTSIILSGSYDLVNKLAGDSLASENENLRLENEGLKVAIKHLR